MNATLTSAHASILADLSSVASGGPYPPLMVALTLRRVRTDLSALIKALESSK